MNIPIGDIFLAVFFGIWAIIFLTAKYEFDDNNPPFLLVFLSFIMRSITFSLFATGSIYFAIKVIGELV